LWNKAGGIDSTFKLAGDYCLWMKFAGHAPLVSVKALVSCFRSVEGQLSQDSSAYSLEMKSLSPGDDATSIRARLFTRYEKFLPGVIRDTVFRMLFGRQEFSVVLIDAKGKLSRVTGEYYDILKHI
jgi:hypothetical protein